ncbi:MAG: hypothetical protein MZW92_24345 [Comamonadaceae bacterium]|nr:hypothetical protein [Comamonadaceae bacterium]
MRPAWMIRAGLFLYDHLAPRARLPGCAAIDLRRHVAGAALRPEYRRAFAFSDVCVQGVYRRGRPVRRRRARGQ